MDTQAGSLFSVEGKTAVVTGGSAGIGRMITSVLAAHGVEVVIVGRKAGPLEDAAASLRAEGGRIDSIVADLSRPDEVARFASVLAERHARLDILVNNAGATWGAPFATFPLDGYEKVMSLNVRAPFLVTQALLPLLEAAATEADFSRVVNVSSIGARHAPDGSSIAYSPSKAAIEQMTRVMARQLGPHRVTANCIAPGWFPTRMNAPLGDAAAAAFTALTPLGRLGNATDIGGVVVFLCSRAGAYVNGQVIDVDGGHSV